MGLSLTGETAAQAGLGKPAHWTYPLLDESRRYCVRRLKCPLPPVQLSALCAKVHDGVTCAQPKGPQGPMPGKTPWMVNGGCQWTYA